VAIGSSQSLSAYQRNGAIYVMTPQCLMGTNINSSSSNKPTFITAATTSTDTPPTIASVNNGSLWGRNIKPYVMPAERSVDINEPFDLKVADMVLSNNLHLNGYSKQ
jgi:CMP-N-acetylneuraminic acid synthetase